MPRVSKTDQELGFIRAFWNEVQTLQAIYGVAFEMHTVLSQRPGVLLFRITTTSLLDGQGEGLGTNAVQFEFPSAQRETLAGALWRFSMKLTELVEEHDKRREKAPNKRRGKG